MDRKLRNIIALLAAALTVLPAMAEEPVPADTTAAAEPHRNIFERVIHYFDQTNKPKPKKQFDMSFIGGPFYSTDTKFGIGLVGSALYYHTLADTVVQPSEVALKAQLSTTLFYSLALDGTHIFSADRWRMNYHLEFASFPTYFWGTGYEAGRHGPKSKFEQRSINFSADILHRLGSHFYFGPMVEADWTDATKRKAPSEPWEGLPRTVTSVGVGVTACLDTRDVITAPESGWYLRLTQRFFPRFLGNTTHSFSSTLVEAAHYRRVWRGGVLAGKFRGLFTYGHTPWPMMATFGGSSTMRGYYEGQYRDKSAADLTIELRQHVWRRSGIAVWVGAATVFSTPSELRWKRILPNAGVGYRFEFKKRVNVRVDVGFGRDTWGVEFNINEAF